MPMAAPSDLAEQNARQCADTGPNTRIACNSAANGTKTGPGCRVSEETRAPEDPSIAKIEKSSRARRC